MRAPVSSTACRKPEEDFFFVFLGFRGVIRFFLAVCEGAALRFFLPVVAGGLPRLGPFLLVPGILPYYRLIEGLAKPEFCKGTFYYQRCKTR